MVLAIRWVFLLFAALPLLGALPRHWPLGSAWIDGAALLFAGLALALAWHQSASRAFFISPVLAWLGGFLAVVLASVSLNDFSQSSAWLWYVVYLVFAAALVLALGEWLAQLGRTGFVGALVDALYWGVLAYALVSLAFYYLGIPEGSAALPRLYGLWAQPNLTSSMVWFGVVAACLRFDARRQWLPLALSLLLFAWVLACAASRTSWLIAAGLLFLTLLSVLPRWRERAFDGQRGILAAGIVAVAVALLVVPSVNDALRGGLGLDNSALALGERNIAPDSGRVYEFKKLQQALPTLSAKAWLVGIGPGQYAQFSSPLDYDLPVQVIKDQTWTHAHNIFAMLLVEMGLLGLLAALALFAVVLWQILRRSLDKEQMFLAGGLLILFAHSNLEYPLWYAWFFCLLCFLLMPLFALKTVEPNAESLPKAKLALVVLLASLAFTINVFSQYWRMVEAKAAEPHDLQAYQSLLNMANNPLLGSYATLLRYRKFAPEAGAFAEQLQEVEQMLAWQPRDMVLMREYSVYLLMGDFDQACALAERNAFRFPRSGPIMLDHVDLAGRVSLVTKVKIERCVQAGLAKRGETIESMREKNRQTLDERFW